MARNECTMQHMHNTLSLVRLLFPSLPRLQLDYRYFRTNKTTRDKDGDNNPGRSWTYEN